MSYLLMGGQACVVYGAAEFSRDIDLLVRDDQANLDKLQAALRELDAEVIAVPPFAAEHLRMGLAVHFRSRHPDSEKLRIDVMSRQRGLDSFEALWARRSTLADIDLLSLPDLVLAKKTQRDKDWPMLSRLVEVNYFGNRQQPTPEQIVFWLRELRNPELLLEVANTYPAQTAEQAEKRPLLLFTEVTELRRALREEEDAERERDRVYWRPLRERLERLRLERTAP